MRRSLASAFAAAFAAVALSAPTSASAADPDNLLVTGTVVDATDGTPKAVSGATVYVWWMPGLRDAQPGDELAIQTVGTAQSGSDGSYAVGVTPTAAMTAEAAENGGWVNFDVGTVASQTGKLETSAVSRQLVAGSWLQPAGAALAASSGGGKAAHAAATEDPAVPESTSGEIDLVITQDSPDVPAATPDGIGPRRQTVETAESLGIAYCSFVVDARPKRHVSVIEFHNASNSNAHWEYGERADSSVDAGIDYGGDGGWSISGSRQIDNGNGAAIGKDYNSQLGAIANEWARTDFEFVDGHYKRELGDGDICEGTSIPVGTKTKNPVEWTGGVYTNTTIPGAEFIGCDQKPQSDNREPYPVGTQFTRDYGSAARIGLAVDIGPITIGAKSGYSSHVWMNWVSKRGNGIWLCGTSNSPNTAGVIHAQNRPG